MLFYLRKWRLGSYLWLLLLPPLVWLGVVVKQHPLVDARPVYRTCAKLLISPNSRGSDLQFNPLTDPRTIQEMTQDQELLEQAVKRSGLALSWIELRSQMQVNTTGHLSDKVDMLEVTLVGTDPDQLEQLGASLVSCLMERMRRLTALEQDKSLRLLSQESRRLKKQFHQSWLQMRRFGVQARPSETLRLAQLQSARAELERDLTLAETASQAPSEPGVMEIEVERARLTLAALREVYLERSLPVRSQSDRLRHLSGQLKISQARSAEVARRRKEVRVAGVRSRLLRLNAEIARLERNQPSTRELLRSSLLEREFQMWQGQVHALQRDLMQTRLERERRVAGLTLVLLERPERSELVAIPSAWWTAWHAWLQRLPESLFFGILLSFAVHYLRGQLRMEARIEEALGLPVLGRIPRMSGELCREWERIKQGGTQHPRGGL